MSLVFIEGELIDLCAPTDGDLLEWSEWFNDSLVTRYLEQGKFPNTPRLQSEYLANEAKRGRFIATIKTKTGRLLGVCSLSEIDLDKRSAQLSYVCPVKDDSARFAALEAAAHCAQHAFDRFAVERVWSGHAYPGLTNWIRKMEIVGFFAEGFHEGGFRHGRYVSDSVRTALTLERFEKLTSYRGGRLWPGQDIASQILDSLRNRPSLADAVALSISGLHTERYRELDAVERLIRK